MILFANTWKTELQDLNRNPFDLAQERALDFPDNGATAPKAFWAGADDRD